MNDEMTTIHGAGSMEENCARLGELIRLGKPVSPDVFVSALNDPDYARNLIVCRDAPPLRDFLLDHAPQRAPAAEDRVAERSTLELAASATKSFWKWTKSGFSVVDDATFARRFDACLACPHLVAQAAKLVYKLAGADAERNKVCELCGCVASKKARLPHESCPAPHAELPGLNKWSEEIR